MENRFMSEIPTPELKRIETEAITGSYRTARVLVEQELAKRTLAVAEAGVVDMAYVVPVDPMDDLQCEACS